MGFFGNIGSSIAHKIGQLGGYIRQGIGHATPYIHKIGMLSRSDVGQSILNKIPYGKQINAGIQAADAATQLWQKVENLKKMPNINEAGQILNDLKKSIS